MMCSFVLRTPSYLIIRGNNLSNSREEAIKTLRGRNLNRRANGFKHSTRALAIPVTYLILFASLIALISATYSYAVVRIGAKGAVLRASVAKQNMLLLNDAIHSVAWSFGASTTVFMDDCGGNFHTLTSAKNLSINVTDGQTFNETVFNSSIGKAYYELDSSESSYDGKFIKGDARTIINQSSFTQTQLYSDTETAKELILCYRPSVTIAAVGTYNGKPLNLIRINIINLNLSQNIMLGGSLHLRITSLNVFTSSRLYEFNQQISSLALTSYLDEAASSVWLPIASNEEGAAVTLEIFVCNIAVQYAEV